MMAYPLEQQLRAWFEGEGWTISGIDRQGNPPAMILKMRDHQGRRVVIVQVAPDQDLTVQTTSDFDKAPYDALPGPVYHQLVSSLAMTLMGHGLSHDGVAHPLTGQIVVAKRVYLEEVTRPVVLRAGYGVLDGAVMVGYILGLNRAPDDTDPPDPEQINKIARALQAYRADDGSSDDAE